MHFQLTLFNLKLLQKIGESWVTQLDDLRKLEKFADDKSFLLKLMKVKQVTLCFFNFHSLTKLYQCFFLLERIRKAFQNLFTPEVYGFLKYRFV